MRLAKCWSCKGFGKPGWECAVCGQRCGACSFSPESRNDYCFRHRPKQRAERLTQGVVVGTATLYGHGEDGTTIEAEFDDTLPELKDGESYRVTLVRLPNE